MENRRSNKKSLRVILNFTLTLVSALLVQIQASADQELVFTKKYSAKPAGSTATNSFNVSIPAGQTVSGEISLKNGIGEDLLLEDCSSKSGSKKTICLVSNAVRKLLLTFLYPTSVEVTLNGQKVVASSDFEWGQGIFRTNVTLKNTNTIVVFVKGFSTASTELRLTRNTAPINLPPTANMILSPNMGFAPLTVSFSGLGSVPGSNPIASYFWEFGNGMTATGPMPIYTYPSAGAFQVRLTVTDTGGRSNSTTQSIVVKQPSPPQVNLSLRSSGDGVAPLMVIFDTTGTSDPSGLPLSYRFEFGDGANSDQLGTVTHLFKDIATYTVRLTVTNSLGLSAYKEVQVIARPPLVAPDPSPMAPVLSDSISVPMSDTVKFLYKGPQAIQKDMVTGVIEERRTAVIRGKVLDEDGNPVGGVRIFVPTESEYGYTLTRADGWFDFVVNGGGDIVVAYERNGYLLVQRKVNASYQNYSMAPNVVLTRLDSKVTVVKMGLASSQIAKGSLVEDSSGARTAAVIIPSGTTAKIQFPNGTAQNVSQLSLRATEYTVGEKGPSKMPATLPQHSAYTYAADITADEAIALGANHIQFSQPVAFYVDNFLNFPAGTNVPVGVYNYDRGIWEPGQNGKVIRILSIDNGVASLDLGGGQPANPSDLAKYGITNEELATLAQNYESGRTLWRAQLDRFSPVDLNWGTLTENGIEPHVPEAGTSFESQECVNKIKGRCVIDVSSQSFTEEIKMPGVPLSLNYNSQFAPGRAAERTLSIPFTYYPDIPEGIESIYVKVDVAGQSWTKEFFSPIPLVTEYTWNGLDAYGREVQGPVKAKITIGYKFSQTYYDQIQNASAIAVFGMLPMDPVNLGIPGRENAAFESSYEVVVGSSLPRGDIGQWTFANHHRYDPASKTLFMGTGEKLQDAASFNGVAPRYVTTIAGTGEFGYNGDNIPAKQAQMDLPRFLTMGKDGSIYVCDAFNYRLRKVRPDGSIVTIAGTGTAGFSGDGGPAIQAQIGFCGGSTLKEGQDESIYFADTTNARIRRIDKNGIITTIAGNGGYQAIQDGMVATEGALGSIPSIALLDDKIIFVDSSGNKIQVIGGDGRIYTIAGNGTEGFAGDNGAAVNAVLNSPWDIAVSKNGEIYFSDRGNNRIRKIDKNGIIATVAGTGNGGYNGDGKLALETDLNLPEALFILPDSTLIIADSYNFRIRMMDKEGIVKTIAGTGEDGESPDGNRPELTAMSAPIGLFYGPDGSIYFADGFHAKVKKIASSFPVSVLGSNAEIMFPSRSGKEIYIFSSQGLHLRTLNADTGGLLWRFGYDGSDHLISITDSDNNVTSIERDGSGNPTAVTSPYGHTSSLNVDGNGDLIGVNGPGQTNYQINYQSGGLLTSFTKPNGAQTSYAYDDTGLLIKDTDAKSAVVTFLKSILNTGHEVTTTSAEGVSKTMRLQRGAQYERLTYTVGGTIVGSDYTGSVYRQSFSPSGDYDYNVVSGDSRLGPMTSYISENIFTRGTVLYQDVTYRDYVRQNSANLFDFERQEVTYRNNALRSWIDFDTATKTYTIVSGENRVNLLIVDDVGRPVFTQVSNFEPSFMSYNARGQLTQVNQGDRVTQYAYNSDGLLAAVKNPMGHISRYQYDSKLALSKEILPDGRQIAYEFNHENNLVSLTPPNGQTFMQQYDILELLTFTIPPAIAGGNTQTQYQYDLDGRVISITKPSGKSASYGYTQTLGFLSGITTSQGNYSFSYDPSSALMTSMTSPDGVTFNYEYIAGGLSRIQQSFPFLSDVAYTYKDKTLVNLISAQGLVTNLSYDLDDLLVQVGEIVYGRIPQTGKIGAIALDQSQEIMSYSQFGELYTRNVMQSGQVIFYQAFDRDKLGRLQGKYESSLEGANTYDYSYDLAGRLVQVKKSGVVISQYGYDVNSNRVSATVNGATIQAAYDAQDRLLSYGDKTYTYTLDGDLNTITDPSGVAQLSYDVFGNLKSYQRTGQRIDYLIDGNNRRVGKKLNGSLIKGYVYGKGLDLLAEVDGQGSTVARFVYGSRANVPDYMIRDGVKYRIAADEIGSVRLVINATTGEVVQRMDYDEFGVVLRDTNPGFQPFGFAGGLYDKDTGLVRFGARDYDPETGRWLSKDPILFGGLQANLYAYNFNDPVNFIDPKGTNPFLIAIGGGALVGAGASFIGTWIATGSFSESLNSVPGGAVAGAGAVLGTLGAIAGGVPTAAAVGIGVAVDLGITFANAPGVLPNGTGKDFGSGINAIFKRPKQDPNSQNSCQ